MSSINLLFIFLASLITSIILTILVYRLAWRLGVVDEINQGSRHIHQRAVPLMGGLAIFLTIALMILLVYFSPIWPVKKFNFFDPFPVRFNGIAIKNILGILSAGALLMIGGYLDDKYKLSPKKQIIWPILACLVIIGSGIGIKYINNPFGDGYWFLDQWKFELFKINQVPFYFTPLADIFTFFWLMLLMYSTKLLDGLDGLVSGVSAIGGLVITVLSLSILFFQPDVAILSLVFSGAMIGFLFFNFYPAKIFLGDGGSLLAGFMLGVLAIVSGGKIATAFLVLGLPILDMLWVFARRVFVEKKSPFIGDNQHLHFRLLAVGFSHRKAVVLIWLVSAVFGLVALFLRTRGKLIMAGFLIIFVLILALFIINRSRKNVLQEKN